MNKSSNMKEMRIYTKIIGGSKITAVSGGDELNRRRKLYILNDHFKVNNERYSMEEKYSTSSRSV